MLSTKNRLSQLVVVTFLLVFMGIAVILKPAPSHPLTVLTVSDDLQITYLLNAVPSKENCEETLATLAHTLLSACPDCSIQTQQCLTKLDTQQQAYLSAAPLPFPSVRLPNRVVIYQSALPDTALTACLEIERASAQSLSEVTCYPSNTSRPMPKFVKVSWVNNLLTIFLILAATGALSWLVCYLIIRYEHLHAHFSHDHNDSGPQKFHASPTPRIGGIAIFSGLMMGAGIALILHPASSFANDNFGYLLLAAIPAFMGGLLEDVTKNVGVLQRLILTMISGAIGAWLLGATLMRLDIPYLDTALHWLPFAMLLTVFAVAGVANAINIIDGYNGLAGGFAVLALIAMAWVAAQVNDNLILVVSLSMIGALLGFLAWNWPRGRIFLGDGGAYLIGFILAELSVLLIARNPTVSPWFPLLLLSYPIFETLFSIYRRKWLRDSTPGHPDALHLHQLVYKRVIRGHMTGSYPILKTKKNSRVAPFFWFAATLSSIFAAIFWQSPPILMMAALTGCALYVLLYRRMTKLGGMSWLGKRK